MPPLKRLLGLGRSTEQPEALYAALLAQARQPAFYQGGVPDTLEGRFDLILLHLLLLLRRLREDALTRALAQDVFDLFFREMDRALREMGVGDLSVPRRVHDMAEAFYGRARAYDAALGTPGNEALEAALARNVFAGAGDGEAPARLAGYARAAVETLAALPREEFLAGRLRFPDPAAFRP
jgi:cytochrome b pre-mRNA-processing protein 3